MFTCYFPEGQMTPESGGLESPEVFKEYVEEMRQKGFDVQFQANLNMEYAKDGDSNILLDACLLQFPYGIGGLELRRLLHDSSMTTESEVNEFLIQLSLWAQNCFQKPLFLLVLYSLLSKQRLFKSACLQLRGRRDSENLARSLEVSDVVRDISGRRVRERFLGTSSSRKLLDSVDATARALPHTNEAASKARISSEAMQHHFGMASVFLTVTFDDENGLVMQRLADKIVDKRWNVCDLSHDDVAKLARQRRQIKVDYPGLGSVHFEVLLNILLEEVVGWDIQKGCSTSKEGFFGKVKALNFAVEEQGQKTLHVHMLIWIDKLKCLQKDVVFNRNNASKNILIGYSNHISTTRLFPYTLQNLRKVFDHKCME